MQVFKSTNAYEFHDAANLFPLICGEELEQFTENMRTAGQIEPIIIHDGKILDGRNRYLVCQKLGIIPKYRTLTDNIDPFEFVWSLNAERRHLPAGQKATIWVIKNHKSQEWQAIKQETIEAANQARSEAQKNIPKAEITERRAPNGAPRSHNKGKKSSTKAAKKTGASSRTVERATTLINKRPDLAAKVASGETSLTNALRVAKKDEVAKNNAELPEDKFRVIYADPPWSYNNSGLDDYGHAERHYPAMSISELCALDIKKMAADDSVLFLWVTSPLLEDSFKVIKAWGFKYKTSFVWDKVKHNFGHYNSVRHEFLLICTRGSCTPDSEKLHDSVVTIEREEHSQKPEQFRDLIDQLYAEGKRIELFARKQSAGWEGWGNESDR